MTARELVPRFTAHFGSAEHGRIFRAPGRVNLIGEHTDYTLGFVLPTALEMACYIARAEAEDSQRIRVFSEERDEERSWDISEIADLKAAGHWSDYFAGVAQGLLRAGVNLRAGRFFVHSEVPEGSGLSSSAAFEVASAFALLNGRS